MSHNNTKLQEKARYNAIKEVKSGRKIAQVARRCAEVVWVEARNRGLDISLSSVRRIIKRAHLERAKSKWHRYRKFTKRPHANYPGALVEVDTVHFYHPITKERKYATSVGPEFGKKFQDEIIRRGMKWRHTRVRRPNDNAHVERFNRYSL